MSGDLIALYAGALLGFLIAVGGLLVARLFR